MASVLIVDDEESICWSLEHMLGQSGYEVQVASSAEQALAQVSQSPPDAILLDVRLPGMDGLAAMEHLRRIVGAVPIVIITAFGDLEVVVAAIRGGAFDYLAKPFDLDQAAEVVQRALAVHRAQPAIKRPQSAASGMIGRSAKMQELFKRIALVATSDASVLITGESGVGKELVARSIHQHSHRAAGPFVPVHLAALSPHLVESELFGHVKGAFTGAETGRQGLLELAHNGTVFFDEAGDIPSHVQVKLLRVLEHQEVTPVGSTQACPAAFRVIAATNRNLSGESSESIIRRDLFYRLAAFEIQVPALRERVEDIPMLAEHFLANLNVPDDKTPCFSREAMDELCRRAWPGNVRQLRHAVEHGALVARHGTIGVEHLPVDAASAAPGDVESRLVEAVRDWARERLAGGESAGRLYHDFLAATEPALFGCVLDAVSQHRAAAADRLGIHRETLRKKLGRGDTPS